MNIRPVATYIVIFTGKVSIRPVATYIVIFTGKVNIRPVATYMYIVIFTGKVNIRPVATYIVCMLLCTGILCIQVKSQRRCFHTQVKTDTEASDGEKETLIDQK